MQAQADANAYGRQFLADVVELGGGYTLLQTLPEESGKPGQIWIWDLEQGTYRILSGDLESLRFLSASDPETLFMLYTAAPSTHSASPVFPRIVRFFLDESRDSYVATDYMPAPVPLAVPISGYVASAGFRLLELRLTGETIEAIFDPDPNVPEAESDFGIPAVQVPKTQASYAPDAEELRLDIACGSIAETCPVLLQGIGPFSDVRAALENGQLQIRIRLNASAGWYALDAGVEQAAGGQELACLRITVAGT